MIKRKKKDGKNQSEVKDRCNRMWKKRTVKKRKSIRYCKADKKKINTKNLFMLIRKHRENICFKYLYDKKEKGWQKSIGS
jgi:hypothetical protein